MHDMLPFSADSWMINCGNSLLLMSGRGSLGYNGNQSA